MAQTTIPERKELASEVCWNLHDLYMDEDGWRRDMEAVSSDAAALTQLRGRLGESAETLLSAMSQEDAIGLRLERVYAYAMLRHDQDTADTHGIEMHEQAQTMAAKAAEQLAFIGPELLSLPEGRIKELVSLDPRLQTYSYSLDRLERMRGHVLGEEAESVLAALSPVLDGGRLASQQLSNADFKFADIKDSEGRSLPLSHGRYPQYVESRDRKLRQSAYLGIHAPYEEHRNTFAGTLGLQVRSEVTQARLRDFPSALSETMTSRALPLEVYANLTSAVHAALPHLHRYIAWRKRVMGVPEFHFYDIYPPAVQGSSPTYSWDEACETIQAGLAPLGPRYRQRLQRVFTERYVDRAENRGKRSGAYSMGVYAVHPYILMSFSGTRDSMFTLAHEAGHSLHSILSSETQSYRNAQYGIFLAEIASTCNENLLLHHLLGHTTDKAARLDLLDDHAQKFLGTVFRQTLFAEFELATHSRVEEGGALTAEYLQGLYRGLLERYYGPELVIDEIGTYEWARIPHFYRGYYVFQYATGFISAAALAEGILREGQPASDRYLEFLSAGGSDDPLNVLRRAGVDLSSPAPLERGLEEFGRIVDELEADTAN